MAIETYEVTITHADLDGPYVVELMASSERAAIVRALMSAMHKFKHAELLHADAVARVIPAFTE